VLQLHDFDNQIGGLTTLDRLREGRGFPREEGRESVVGRTTQWAVQFSHT
jgi:hypothetical protein